MTRSTTMNPEHASPDAVSIRPRLSVFPDDAPEPVLAELLKLDELTPFQVLIMETEPEPWNACPVCFESLGGVMSEDGRCSDCGFYF